MGIAMGYVELATMDLAEGRLVQPFEMEVQHPWSYYIVIPEDNVGDLKTAIFSDWLRAEARKTSRGKAAFSAQDRP